MTQLKENLPVFCCCYCYKLAAIVASVATVAAVAAAAAAAMAAADAIVCMSQHLCLLFQESSAPAEPFRCSATHSPTPAAAAAVAEAPQGTHMSG
jgi:hypothetical protein